MSRQKDINENKTRILRSEGQLPVVPPSEYRSDNSWTGASAYKGQLVINTAEQRIWSRGDIGIFEIITENNISGYTSGAYVNITGDTMTGNLTLAQNSTTLAPLTFQSGDLLFDSCFGCVEFENDDYYASISTPASGVTYIPSYPVAYTSDYIKATTEYTTFYTYYATNPALPLTGSTTNTTWLSNSQINQRFHIDLGSAQPMNRIYYENYHATGGGTIAGCRHFTIWGSNDASAFSALTYTADTNWTELTASVNEFDIHVSSDVADPKYISVTNLNTYRYYAFKFSDNWGHSSKMGLRHIELQYGSVNYRKGIILNDGENLIENYIPVATTNGRLIDSSLQISDVLTSTTLTNTYIGYGSTGNTLTGSSGLTWDGSDFYIGGNVGIGQSSPTSDLHILNTGTETSLEISSGVVAAQTGLSKIILRPYNSGTATSYSRVEIEGRPGGAGDTNLAFKTTTDGSGPQDRMFITHSGLVGVGTSTPNHQLTINSSISSGLLLNAASTVAQRFARGGVNKWGLINNSGGVDFFTIYNYSIAEYSLAIDASTNYIGIGTASPTEKLHVDCNVLVNSGITTNDMTINDILVSPNKSSAPSSPVSGQIYFDTTTTKLRCYDGASWNDLF